MIFQRIHKNFTLNGNSLTSADELLRYVKIADKQTHQFLQQWFSFDDVIVVHTSGSTGKPKPIQIKKEYMVNSALATGSFFNLPEKTTALLCLSTNYIAGKMMLVRALILGWHLDIVSPISNPLKLVHKTYDFSAMVPMQLHNSLTDLHKVKKLIIGGGIVSKELQNKIQKIDTEIFATYGMTETVTHIAIKKLNYLSLIGGKTEQSFYQVFPNIKISQDHRNCLIIYAPKISSEKIFTNDVVQLISKNKFKWLGRYDHVINSGGVKLHPEEIEQKLSEVITQRFFVAGIFDELLGEKLILVVESVELSNLKSKVLNLKSLSKFEIPKEIYFVDRFIETGTKKIQRKKTLDLIDKL